MYLQYFGLSELPFSIAPDPRYLFLSNKHREALAHLIYGVGDQGGFVVLTGEVGTGKTTICRCLLQQIPDNADVAYIVNPAQSVNQLLQSIFNDLSITFEPGSSSKDLVDQLNEYLLGAHARGRNTIIIIDEAQNLSSEILEQLRLLTNLETNEKKLLQLVLLGQPELNELLSKPELRQLAQRVTARYHLSPLSRREVSEYIAHRLSIAGCRTSLFSRAAIAKIYRLSQGVPRLINVICDRSLLGVYATNSDRVTPAVVNTAAKEVFTQGRDLREHKYWLPAIVALAASVLLAITVMYWDGESHPIDSAGQVSKVESEKLPVKTTTGVATSKRDEPPPAEQTKNPPEPLASSREQVDAVDASSADPAAQPESAPKADIKPTAVAASGHTQAAELKTELAQRKATALELTNKQHTPELPLGAAKLQSSVTQTQPSVPLPGWMQLMNDSDKLKPVLTKLYQMWNLTTESVDARNCMASNQKSKKVYCRKAISTVSQLRAYNSPIVLAYKFEEGRIGYLLVTKLSENTATVEILDKAYSVPVSELFNSRFFDSYVLTRIPGNIELPIFPGDTGPAIRWLQSQLSHYDENSPNLTGKPTVDDDIATGKNKYDFLYGHHLIFGSMLISNNYDGTLQKQIMRLQKQLGMVGNGIVDVALLVALNKTSFKTDPSLYPQQMHNGFSSDNDNNELFGAANNPFNSLQES